MRTIHFSIPGIVLYSNCLYLCKKIICWLVFVSNFDAPRCFEEGLICTVWCIPGSWSDERREGR